VPKKVKLWNHITTALADLDHFYTGIWRQSLWQGTRRLTKEDISVKTAAQQSAMRKNPFTASPHYSFAP
jgi:hypothetical protein